jgi:hypothetical protein
MMKKTEGRKSSDTGPLIKTQFLGGADNQIKIA